MSRSIEQNIEEWLANKGFPFEIQCSRAFKNHGFKVQQSLHYLDEEINSHREIDICAWRSLSIDNFAFNLTLVVECKTSDTPWIVFTDLAKHSQPTAIKSFLISKNGDQLIKKMDVMDKGTFSFSVLEDEPFGYNFVQMKKSGGEKDKDHAYEAIIQSSKAAITLKKESDNSRTKFCNLYIPVVIVEKNLFRVSESSDSKTLNIEPIKFCKHGKLLAFTEKPLLIHHIVSGQYLDEYLNVISKDFEYFFTKYRSEIEHIAKTNPQSSGKGEYSLY